MNVNCTSETCDYVLNSKCVFYEGVALPYAGISTNDSLEAALQKINTAFQNISTSGSVAWGDITGLLSNQSDLISYINNYTPINRTLTINGVTQDLSSNRAWTIVAGDMVLASTQTNSGAKTFLDNTLLMRNVANTNSSRFTNTNTSARTYTLPNVSGTVLLSGVTLPISGATQLTLTSSDLFAFNFSGSTSNDELTIGLGSNGVGFASEYASDTDKASEVKANEGTTRIKSTDDSYVSRTGEFVFENATAIYSDTKGTPTGIQYTSSGYETSDLTLTSRGYVNSGTATLSNKTFNLSSNTLTGTKTQFNTALSDDDFAFKTDLSSWITGTLTGSVVVDNVGTYGIRIGDITSGVNGAELNTGPNYAGIEAKSGTIQLRFTGVGAGEAIFTDIRGTKLGIQYAASGYVTDPRSLTDKGYVDGLAGGMLIDAGTPGAIENGKSLRWNNGTTSWEYFTAGTGSGDMVLASTQTNSGAKTFINNTLLLRNSINTFNYTVTTSAIAANRTITIPLLTASDVFMFEGFPQTVSGAKTFLDNTLMMRNVANTFSSRFTNTNTSTRTYTLPDYTGPVLVGNGTQTLTNTTTLNLDTALSFWTFNVSNSGVFTIGTDNGTGFTVTSGAFGGITLSSAIGTQVSQIQASGITGHITWTNIPDVGNFSEATSLTDVAGSLTYDDNLASPKGIMYSAAGYVTDARSLTDKGYVDGNLIGKTLPAAPTGTEDGKVLSWDNGSNAWVYSTLSGSGIGGSTGATDNSVLRADGTGGATLQNSSVFIDDSANLTLGTVSLAGSRQISVASSTADANLTILSQGSGIVKINNNVDFRLATASAAFVDTYTLIGLGALTMRAIGALTIGGTGSTSGTPPDVSVTGNQAGGTATVGGAVKIRGGLSAVTAIKGGDVNIIGGDASVGNADSGDVYISSPYNFGTGKKGNLGISTLSVADWQDMELGVYLGNRTTAPTSGIANGVALFAEDSNSSSEFYVMPETGAKVNISGLLEPVTESGTSFTLNETHRNKVVLCTNSGAITVTVNAGKAAGWNCLLLATNATGTISLSASGTTINGTTATTVQFETLSIVHYGSENYLSKLG